MPIATQLTSRNSTSVERRKADALARLDQLDVRRWSGLAGRGKAGLVVMVNDTMANTIKSNIH